MFSTSVSESSSSFNFENDENMQKWKKVFTSSLQKVLSYVHPKMIAKEDALDYVESLIIRLLVILCASPAPHSVQDVEDRVSKTFPNPIDQWVIEDAQTAIEKGKKRTNLMLPIDKVHSLLRDTLQIKLDYQVSLYIVAVLEYISADILKLAGSYVKNIKDDEVSQQDIRVAMCADKVLMDMFDPNHNTEDPLLGPLVEEISSAICQSVSQEDLVKHLILDEKAYIKELNMIMKVFRDKLYDIGTNEKEELDFVFSNIDEIYDFSLNFLCSLEESLEVTENEEIPAIISCFEEMAEGAEFDVYGKYGEDVLNSSCHETLFYVVEKPAVSAALKAVRPGFKEAVKYYLPRLMLMPVKHAFSYFKYIECFLAACEEENETRENWEQVKGVLWPLQNQLDRAIQNSPYNFYLRKILSENVTIGQSRSSRQMCLQRLHEVQKSIDCWEGKDIAQCSSEFIMDGPLKFGNCYRKQTDRHAFLFDALLVLCKAKGNEYKFKEKYLLRMIEIVDRDDTEELRNSFEIRHRDQGLLVFSAKSAEEKNNWMAALVKIDSQSMLERILDSILHQEETQHPLCLPDPTVYPFSIEDSEDNIVIEERSNAGHPIIRGAVLLKLIERLTYHMYADPMFVRTFLTTYRSFTTPREFLHLLIQRFDIPEPKPPDLSDESPPDLLVQKLNFFRASAKRFRKEYSQPVQFRVLNVLRHWVDYHFYDFASDRFLLDILAKFLENVKAKSMKKWVESITKIINRKLNEEPREITFSHTKTPPSPMTHLPMEESDWESALNVSLGNNIVEPDQIRPLLMLHPIEVARQLTLLDFELYRAVKPSELVGTHWTKEDKASRSPNLLKMIQHTNAVTNWLQRCVVECENFEERIAVMSRIIEILVMLVDLNNFSGVFQVSGALESASVHRLELTKAEIRKRTVQYQLKIYEEAIELGKNHYKKYLEKLRSINPPCVPFFGMYLTNILHIEEGNPDFLSKPNDAKGLINFNKRRKLADITAEIQQYQNQPYCLQVQPRIRNFLESLPPFAGFATENEVSNYLYIKSKEVEPKHSKKPLHKERKWSNLCLKSPGIKHRSGRFVPNPLPSMFGSGHKTSEGGTDGDETPHHLTPPTPLSPQSPPHSAPLSPDPSDHSIFATVEIGTGRIVSSQGEYRGPPVFSSGTNPSVPPSYTASVPPTPSSLGGHPPPPYTRISQYSLPPPLPPRRRRETSSDDASPKVKQAPGAPQLPPRDPSPPPRPPRSGGGNLYTLPRMCSGSASQVIPHSLSGGPFTPPVDSLRESLQSPFQSSPHSIPPHHQAPFMGAPAHLQYRLDPPPQRRRTCSVDITGSRPAPVVTQSSLTSDDTNSDLLESPPPPPPRLGTRLSAAFAYDAHNL